MKETALFSLYGDSYGEKFHKQEDRIRELEQQVEKMKAVLQKVYDADYEIYPIRCAVAECLGIKEA